jgi:hypothetical protein
MRCIETMKILLLSTAYVWSHRGDSQVSPEFYATGQGKEGTIFLCPRRTNACCALLSNEEAKWQVTHGRELEKGAFGTQTSLYITPPQGTETLISWCCLYAKIVDVTTSTCNLW